MTIDIAALRKLGEQSADQEKPVAAMTGRFAAAIADELTAGRAAIAKLKQLEAVDALCRQIAGTAVTA
ncbi:hypothetical protein CA235_09615 [Sphingomonas sp. ABOLF]|uniref:hypothetical protein n=1 Tax=Sphingomonas sp. ABOLF TaxID=1985879 RepID=UPI000F7F9FCE|nr:hypothetical protein [Sphingomonas sp. ABOLF]RSV15183.1 hypothetical protein CA235_09615 [Sphingomonas sp. ABOLF]